MQTMRVYPNPFAAFDRDGDPCGVCPRDPESDGGGPGQFVGARIDRNETKILQDFGKSVKFGDHSRHELRSPMQKTKYSYLGVASNDPSLAALLASKEPVEIPITSYYKERIREGSIVPADAETAKRARIPFTPPAQLFAFRSMKTAPAAEEAPVEVASAVVVAGGPAVTLEIPASDTATADAVDSNSTRKRSSKAESEA
jgi:hypothetical protein